MTRLRLSEESGSVALEAVLVIPVIVLTLLTVIQVSLVAYSSHVATFAAREGASASRLSGNPSDGRAQAEDFLRHLGATTLLQPRVTASIEQESAVVEVTGHAPALLPGFDLQVSGRSRGPLERFVPGERP